jgi:hypothetical protein
MKIWNNLGEIFGELCLNRQLGYVFLFLTLPRKGMPIKCYLFSVPTYHLFVFRSLKTFSRLETTATHTLPYNPILLGLIISEMHCIYLFKNSIWRHMTLRHWGVVGCRHSVSCNYSVLQSADSARESTWDHWFDQEPFKSNSQPCNQDISLSPGSRRMFFLLRW